MREALKFIGAWLVSSILAGCAPQSALPRSGGTAANVDQRQHVRTTAYTMSEGTGQRNALGISLSGRHVMSAASDWSRYPPGTRFRVVGTEEEYIIDDYGTALVGTNTIDLCKPTRLAMRRWGVRHVDIDVLQWGSTEESLKVLRPRKKQSAVRRMILALEKNVASGPLSLR